MGHKYVHHGRTVISQLVLSIAFEVYRSRFRKRMIRRMLILPESFRFFRFHFEKELNFIYGLQAGNPLLQCMHR